MEAKQTQGQEKKEEERIVRIMSTDIPGRMNIYTGLTKIKGISWSMSNAICNVLGLDKSRKMATLSDDEIKKIEEFLKNPDVPAFLKNRRFDRETGEDLHYLESDLSLRKQFDIKRLRKIKTYRGLRHALGLPVRGQRTRSHFRTHGARRAVGVKKKKK